MSINNTKRMRQPAERPIDIFDDDFEVIYEGDLPDLPEKKDDNFKDVLSNLSELDDTGNIDYLEENYTASFDDDKDYYDQVINHSGNSQKKAQKKGTGRGGKRYASRSTDAGKKNNKKKRRNTPNLLSPAAKTAKAGGKLLYHTVNLALRAATLVIIAVINVLLALSFWKHYGAYGKITSAIAEQNYILGAYFGIALFLLLIECIAFLVVLFGSKTGGGRNGRRIDTGKGLFSFIVIYAGSYLSASFHELIPQSPAPLKGVQGALEVYGSLQSSLLILCIAGVISCLIRRFLVR